MPRLRRWLVPFAALIAAASTRAGAEAAPQTLPDLSIARRGPHRPAPRRRQTVHALAAREERRRARARAENDETARCSTRARAQIGDGYAFGGSGPDAFDCSGLTAYAFASADVALPHNSHGQAALGRPVARDDIRQRRPRLLQHRRRRRVARRRRHERHHGRLRHQQRRHGALDAGRLLGRPLRHRPPRSLEVLAGVERVLERLLVGELRVGDRPAGVGRVVVALRGYGARNRPFARTSLRRVVSRSSAPGARRVLRTVLQQRPALRVLPRPVPCRPP